MYLNLQFSSFSLLYLIQTALIGLAFAAAIGITFLVLGCALPEFNNWWPMFVIVFYILSPVPTVMARRLSGSLDTASSACVEMCMFLTTGIVVSAIGLPVVLAHVDVIQWGACGLVLAGNVVVFLTILGYFFVFANDDVDYTMW
ncbi:hypothetical protein ScPMuIL_000690 [Solemya velum]